MADLDKKLYSALGKKGAATKKQTKLTKQIAQKEAENVKLKEKMLDADKLQSKFLRKQLQASNLELQVLKKEARENKNNLTNAAKTIKSITKQINDGIRADEKVRKQQENAEKKARNKAQKRANEVAKQKDKELNAEKKEQDRVLRNARGTSSVTTSYDKMGLYTMNERVSKLFKDKNLASAGLKNAIDMARKKQGFVPGKMSHKLYQTKNGEWGFDLNAQYKEQAPQKSVMSRAWDGVKLAVESIKEVIGKLLSALSKFLGGVGKVVKGLWKFGKNIAKIALGLPLFNALFAKLASLNGLNAFEFVGASTGAGNATTARNLKIIEDMYGTDGSMSKIAGSRMDLLANPANLRFLQMIGMSDDEIKGKDANMFALSYAKKLSAWFQQQTGGMSLDEIAKNPTDSRVRAAYSAYNATGMSNIMSLESLLGYDNVYKHGYADELTDLSQGKGALYKAIKEQNELKSERKYQASLVEWQNLWIKLATKIAPYMTEISNGLSRLASGFIDLLFNNGGFQKMVNVFMSAFRKITEWLKSKEVRENIEKALNWMGDKVVAAYSYLTETQVDGKTGLDAIIEKLSGLWGTLKTILGYIADIAMWVGDKLGLTDYSKLQEKYSFLKMGALDVLKSWDLMGIDYKAEDMLLKTHGVNSRIYQKSRMDNQLNLQEMMKDIRPEIEKMSYGEAKQYLDAMVAGNKIDPNGSDQQKFNYVVFESILSVLQSINGKINTGTPLRVLAQQ